MGSDGRFSTPRRWLRRIRLDEEFCKRMDESLALKFDFKVQDKRFKTENKLISRLNSWLLYFIQDFCYLSFEGNKKRLLRPTMGSFTWAQRILKLRRLTATGRLIYWPNLVLAMYFLCSIEVVCSIYHQYTYDKFIFHARRFQLASETGQTILLADYRQSNVTQQGLVRRAQEAQKRLRLFGAPHMEATYGCECCYLFLLMVAYICYFNVIIYTHLINPLELYLCRLVLDRHDEMCNFNRLIARQVNKYIQSSCNFTEASINRCVQLSGFESIRLEGLSFKSELRRLVVDHKLTVSRLKHMALEGKLQPMSRTNDWIDWLSAHFVLQILRLISVMIFFASLVGFLVPHLVGFKLQLEPVDQLVLIELYLLWCIAMTSAMFQVALVVYNCMDQVKTIEGIILAIGRCIDGNFARYHKNFSPPGTSFRETTHAQQQLLTSTERIKSISKNCDFRLEFSERWTIQKASDDVKVLVKNLNELAPATNEAHRRSRIVAEMNSDLLSVVLHYKIFMAQLKVIQSSLGFNCLTATVLIFLMPIITRLHVPYLTGNAKVLGVLFGCMCTIMSDICLVPICQLHVKCLDLHKALWNLLAHTVEVSEQSSETYRIYDRHTLWMLQKELSHPDRLASQFVASAFGVLFNYPNLIRIHFWFSILILSIMTDVRSEQEEVIGSFVSDPLGIFSITFV